MADRVTIQRNQRTTYLPENPPYYLIACVSMILRNPENEEVRRIIQQDPLLKEVLYSQESEILKKDMIVEIVHLLQEAYGIDFERLGSFAKGVRQNIEESFLHAIALIWNYSPEVRNGIIRVEES